MSTRADFFCKIDRMLQAYIQLKLGMVLKVGAELEFYLTCSDQGNLAKAQKDITEHGLQLHSEKGYNQFEIVIAPTTNVLDLISKVRDARSAIKVLAKRNNCEAVFSAKPFEGEYGSALHLSISLHNSKGTNFFSGGGDIEQNQYMSKSIAGILDISDEAVYVLCRESQDFKRLVPHFDAPTHIGWGGNNRTTIIRVPQSGEKRIEFRLAPASCDISDAVMVVCVGIIRGFVKDVKLPPRIHGNAFDPQYKLAPLPSSRAAAQNCFEKGGKIIYHTSRITPSLVINKDIWKSI